jgi:addiction module HigA family antidote
MLREDFLPDYGLTASGFAKALGVSRRTVNELLRERRGVSPRTALFLSRFFGNSPEFWLNAQRNVDLWDALQTNRKKINRIVPLKHIRRTRLARECGKVDPRVEKAFAEEGMGRCPGCRRRRAYNQASRATKPRQGWPQRFRAMAERGDDKLLDVE